MWCIHVLFKHINHGRLADICEPSMCSTQPFIMINTMCLFAIHVSYSEIASLPATRMEDRSKTKDKNHKMHNGKNGESTTNTEYFHHGGQCAGVTPVLVSSNSYAHIVVA